MAFYQKIFQIILSYDLNQAESLFNSWFFDIKPLLNIFIFEKKMAWAYLLYIQSFYIL